MLRLHECIEKYKHDVNEGEMWKWIAQFVGNVCAVRSDLIFSDQRNARDAL